MRAVTAVSFARRMKERGQKKIWQASSAERLRHRFRSPRLRRL